MAFRGFSVLVIVIIFSAHTLLPIVESIYKVDFETWKCDDICDNYDVDDICQRGVGAASGTCQDVVVKLYDKHGDTLKETYHIGVCKNKKGKIIKCVTEAQKSYYYRTYNYNNGVCDDTGNEYQVPERDYNDDDSE